MGLTKLAGKLDEYVERLERGKAAKIEPSHVEKVIAKLRAKQTLLHAEIQDTKKLSKKERLQGKLATTHAQIERAEWLLAKIGA